MPNSLMARVLARRGQPVAPPCKESTPPAGLIRFHDSESALIWDGLKGNGVNLVATQSLALEKRTAALRITQHHYVCCPPFAFVHASHAKEPTNGILVWAVRNSEHGSLLHVVSSQPIADTIVAVALGLQAKAVFLRWALQPSSLVKCYLLRLTGARSNVAFDVEWLLRPGLRHSARIPKVFIRLGN